MSLFNLDGWKNIIAGLGKRFTDKTRHTQIGDYEMLIDENLTALWLGEGLGKKIVSSVADDMTRNWIEIQNDEKDEIQKELTRIEAETKVNEALKWMRLYRGSLIIVGVNDGRELDQPLGTTFDKIEWLKVYAAPRVKIDQTHIVTDPESPYFEDVEIFPVQKLNGDIMNVHHSRCIVFKGDPTPNTHGQEIDFQNLYWGTSILQSIWERLKNLGAVEQGIANLMMEVIIGKYKLSGLADILAANNVEAVYNRMEIINSSKSVINGVLLGENEDYVRDSANLSGIPDTMDRFMIMVSAVSEIPVTRLFGRSPAGENATGDADLRTYYDMVQSKQKTTLMPPLQLLVNMINKYTETAKEGDAVIEFNPVWVPTQKEMIEMRDKQSQTDERYVNMGVLDAEEIRTSRFENGYSFETELQEGGAPGQVEE